MYIDQVLDVVGPNSSGRDSKERLVPPSWTLSDWRRIERRRIERRRM
jgi:hypothetical protein